MRKGRERSKCYYRYNKIENKKKKRKIQIGNFLSEIGKKNILFGIGNGAEFRPQNWVIESPDLNWKLFEKLIFLILWKPKSLFSLDMLNLVSINKFQRSSLTFNFSAEVIYIGVQSTY